MHAGTEPTNAPGHALLDAGDGRRLERFGARIVDRPAPAATSRRRAPELWAAAEVRFEVDHGWTGAVDDGPWLVELGGITLEARLGAAGGLGLFPEHLANEGWLASAIRRRRGDGPPTVLNLFAHTGLATLLAARSGAEVVHVDAARAALAWARRNAAHAGLHDAPIRWIVDDAASFVAREARRGRRYDGLILDPPSFGRAGRARWRLLDDLGPLLEGCARLLEDDAFVLLTAHTTGVDGEALATLAGEALGRRRAAAHRTVVPLRLDADSGAHLDLGWAVRLD